MLSEDNVKVLEEIKSKHNIKTDSKGINFIIEEYTHLLTKKSNLESNNQILVEHLLNGISEQYGQFFHKASWALRISETNSVLLLDAINTMLVSQGLTNAIPVDTWESPVITESRKVRKDKIEYNKQVKDNSKMKTK